MSTALSRAERLADVQAAAERDRERAEQRGADRDAAEAAAAEQRAQIDLMRAEQRGR